MRKTGLLAGGVLLGAQGAFPDTVSAAAENKDLPQRALGKTKVPITALSLGTAPCGFSKHVSARQIADIVNTALDEGITAVDTARAYGNAEDGVGMGLGSRRKKIFLGTKVWADTIEEAEKSLAESFKTLKTDYFDALYFHNLGARKLEGAMGPEGVFNWLVKQKKAGKARFIGISAHDLPMRTLPFIESGELDILLMNMNFIDRHIYDFEQKVLPVARKHKVGVLAMKVFAGPRGGFDSYEGPKVPPQVGEKYMELAIRYALGLRGVTAVNIGVHEPQQVRQNVRMVKNYRPLSREERAMLGRVGRQMAAKLGPRFGRVTEETAAT